MKINGQSVAFIEGATILEIARAADIYIPTLCHRQGLPPVGGCGICIVEDLATGVTMPACATVAIDSLDISTDSERVVAIRRSALELLLSDHPADCEAPCQMACPSGLPVQHMLEFVAAGRWDEARAVAHQYPFVCGESRADTPCEKVCRRAVLGGAVAICAIHRFLCDDRAVEKQKIERSRHPFRSRMKSISDEELLELADEPGARVYSGTVPIDQDVMIYEARRCLKCGCERPHNCELRDLCGALAVKQPPYVGTNRHIFREQGPGGFRFDSSRCILCGRCVRAAAELKTDISPACHGRGFDARIAPPLGRTWNDMQLETLKVCVDACPTGAMAFTS